MTKVLKALLPIVTVVLFSCKKEKSAEPDNGGTTKLTGTYEFAGAEVRTESAQTVALGGETMKSVTRSHYFTKDNKGTYLIEGSKITGKDIAYRIDTVVHVWTYLNGVLEDHEEVGFTFTLEPVGSAGNYRLAGTDSIYIENGFTQLPDGGTQLPSQVSAFRYSWSGDTLVMKSTFNKTFTMTQGGIPVTVAQAATITSKMKKRS